MCYLVNQVMHKLEAVVLPVGQDRQSNRCPRRTHCTRLHSGVQVLTYPRREGYIKFFESDTVATTRNQSGNNEEAALFECIT